MKEQFWVFTFGQSEEIYGDRAKKAVRIFADSYGDARQKMYERYGDKWAFQYSAKEWEKFENDPERFWYLEEIAEEIR